MQTYKSIINIDRKIRIYKTIVNMTLGCDYARNKSNLKIQIIVTFAFMIFGGLICHGFYYQ